MSRTWSIGGRLALPVGFALALATGCALLGPGPAPGPGGAMRPPWPWARPALVDGGDPGSLRVAVERSLAWLSRLAPGERLVFGPREVTAAEQVAALRRLLGLLDGAPSPDALARHVRAGFEVLASVEKADGRMLVTSYYKPVIDAALTPGPEHAVPVYGVPDDLIEASLERFDPRWRGERIVGRLAGRRLVPYWERDEIAAGRLAGRGLELAWARDAVDLFFVEIQGSGTLRLPDGGEVRIGYAASNGRPYRSIGRILIDEGRMAREAVSLPALRTWLAEHPEERARILGRNESVVFFRRLEGPPVGSLGVPVTPERSIATDARLFPPAALAFLRTEYPVRTADGGVAWQPLARFVLNHDTGGAIRGPGRVDLFWGRGPKAELAAGLMKQPGDLYFLVPRPGPATG